MMSTHVLFAHAGANQALVFQFVETTENVRILIMMDVRAAINNQHLVSPPPVHIFFNGIDSPNIGSTVHHCQMRIIFTYSGLAQGPNDHILGP